ncbi:MAG: hypothetical protein ABSF03_18655 [Streptosporangiaceae bacterium]
MTSPPPASPGPADPVPNPFIPDPVTIACIGCGQAFVCDATSPAARDQTCNTCALGPLPPAPSPSGKAPASNPWPKRKPWR